MPGGSSGDDAGGSPIGADGPGRPGSHETARETACLPGRETLSETVWVVNHQSYSELEKASDANTRSVTWTRAGVVLLVVSALLWVPLPIVPFLPLIRGRKGTMGNGTQSSAETTNRTTPARVHVTDRVFASEAFSSSE